MAPGPSSGPGAVRLAEPLVIAQCQHQLPLGGGRDHAVAVLERCGHRLLDQHVLAALGCQQRFVDVTVVRRTADDRVDVFPTDQLLKPSRHSRSHNRRPAPEPVGRRPNPHKLGPRARRAASTWVRPMNPEPVKPMRISDWLISCRPLRVYCLTRSVVTSAWGTTAAGPFRPGHCGGPSRPAAAPR
ncbi:MAG: hypothetical protein CM1200mP2_17370 [Planctomycetaceae bacterium]|nr:MAG: hypothetical protein CM1200mP2_17370 [Planctomycetaceae bacterium]